MGTSNRKGLGDMAKMYRLACLAMVVIAVGSMAAAQETEVVWLSGQGKDDPTPWEFFCTAGRNSGQWTTIGVPSNWELQGFGTYNYGHDKNKGDEQGKYRRTFTVPTSWGDKRIFIVFDGVMTDTEVFVNGQSAGPKHQGGFYRFKYEITDLVKAGENLLEVTVSKVSSDRSVEAAERQADYWVFGGIYRPVRLEVVPRQFIEWLAIDATEDGSILADVHLNDSGDADIVRSKITGPLGVPTKPSEEQIIEWSTANGSQGGTIEVGVALGSPGQHVHEVGPVVCEPFEANVEAGRDKVTLRGQAQWQEAWTAETPFLYEMKVELRRGGQVLHAVTKRFGFRTFEVRPGRGLYLNGQKIVLKGVCRHSFWPDSGRCLSPEISLADVKLIKEMNMNAVRMSHYPPDEHFLDACDELGLYVLDELSGWQKPPYDTEIGKKLVKEMVTRDVCHPSILFWDNGNEGGWNRDLDGEFALYDPQKRTVLHPWENFGSVDTDHYETYASTQKKLSGRTLFMPTEFLHGLYDGGHGAGLDDYWNLTLASPMGAGGFLWALVDEGVVRTDKDGAIDVDGNHAPDGIVGPYRQKEASFYTIKEIWSPIHIATEKLPEDFDGRLEVENRYDFTNLQDCTFAMTLANFPSPADGNDGHTVLFRRTFAGPDVPPHAKGTLLLSLPDNWRDADALYVTASDAREQEIWKWSWDLHRPDRYRRRYAETETPNATPVEAVMEGGRIRVTAGNLAMQFAADAPTLLAVSVADKPIAFTGGPRLIGGESGELKSTITRQGESIVIDAQGQGDLKRVRWTVHPTGWLRLEYEYTLDGRFDLFGVGFDYPEDRMHSMRFLGEGPYRVWKNRLKGGVLDVWSNRYKNDVPGVTWDFPEFKGYYRDWRWVVFTTEDGDVTMVNETPELFLGVYRPNDGPSPANTKLNVPDTGIALLHGIPAIGTKFNKPELLGPESQKNQASGVYRGDVWFHFDSRE